MRVLTITAIYHHRSWPLVFQYNDCFLAFYCSKKNIYLSVAVTASNSNQFSIGLFFHLQNHNNKVIRKQLLKSEIIHAILLNCVLTVVGLYR